MMDIFVIECPACGKNRTVTHMEDEGRCTRCKADLTALIRIRNATVRSWTQVIACLASGEMEQAQAIVKSINQLTPLSDDEPLVWLLKSVDAGCFQNEMEIKVCRELEQQIDGHT